LSITNLAIFAERLKELRGLRSKAQFARELGLKSAATYFHYEQGRIPSETVLEIIAEKCNVSVKYLLGQEPALSSRDRSCLVEETRRIDATYEERLIEDIRTWLVQIRIMPDRNEESRQAIDRLLVNYATWCKANLRNEEMLYSHTTEQPVGDQQKEDRKA
jgi:transcriptional regulator with XRE-family HTH domain